MRYFSAIKNNLSPVSNRALKFAFYIKEGKIVIQEGQEVPDVEEILRPETREERKERPRERAKRFIQELFKDKTEVEAAEVNTLAEREGIKHATLQKARAEMNIKVIKEDDIWRWRI